MNVPKGLFASDRSRSQNNLRDVLWYPGETSNFKYSSALFVSPARRPPSLQSNIYAKGNFCLILLYGSMYEMPFDWRRPLMYGPRSELNSDAQVDLSVNDLRLANPTETT